MLQSLMTGRPLQTAKGISVMGSSLGLGRVVMGAGANLRVWLRNDSIVRRRRVLVQRGGVLGRRGRRQPRGSHGERGVFVDDSHDGHGSKG